MRLFGFAFGPNPEVPDGVSDMRTVQLSSVALTADVGTSSGTFVVITGMTTTITTGPNRLACWAKLSFHADAAPGGVLAVFVDGVQKDVSIMGANGYGTAVCVALTALLTAGSHTIDMRWKSFGANLLCSAAASPDFYSATLLVQEIAA